MIDENETFLNPDFEPTDEQWQEVAESALLVTKWRSAMADKGIKVLSMGLSPSEENRRAHDWIKEQQNTPSN